VGCFARRVKDCNIAVLARVAVENVHHFTADPVDHVALRGVNVFLIFVLLALKLRVRIHLRVRRACSS